MGLFSRKTVPDEERCEALTKAGAGPRCTAKRAAAAHYCAHHATKMARAAGKGGLNAPNERPQEAKETEQGPDITFDLEPLSPRSGAGDAEEQPEQERPRSALDSILGLMASRERPIGSDAGEEDLEEKPRARPTSAPATPLDNGGAGALDELIPSPGARSDGPDTPLSPLRRALSSKSKSGGRGVPVAALVESFRRSARGAGITVARLELEPAAPAPWPQAGAPDHYYYGGGGSCEQGWPAPEAGAWPQADRCGEYASCKQGWPAPEAGAWPQADRCGEFEYASCEQGWSGSLPGQDLGFPVARSLSSGQLLARRPEEAPAPLLPPSGSLRELAAIIDAGGRPGAPAGPLAPPPPPPSGASEDPAASLPRVAGTGLAAAAAAPAPGTWTGEARAFEAHAGALLESAMRGLAGARLVRGGPAARAAGLGRPAALTDRALVCYPDALLPSLELRSRDVTPAFTVESAALEGRETVLGRGFPLQPRLGAAVLVLDAHVHDPRGPLAPAHVERLGRARDIARAQLAVLLVSADAAVPAEAQAEAESRGVLILRDGEGAARRLAALLALHFARAADADEKRALDSVALCLPWGLLARFFYSERT
eukprot:tig00000093_g3478.t1